MWDRFLKTCYEFKKIIKKHFEFCEVSSVKNPGTFNLIVNVYLNMSSLLYFVYILSYERPWNSLAVRIVNQRFFAEMKIYQFSKKWSNYVIIQLWLFQFDIKICLRIFVTEAFTILFFYELKSLLLHFGMALPVLKG